MSLRGLKHRLESLENRDGAGYVTVVTTSGSTLRIVQRRVLKMFGDAMKLAEPYEWEVPDEALSRRPDLLSVKHMESSDEHGSLLDLVKCCLLGPARTASADFEQCGDGTS